MVPEGWEKTRLDHHARHITSGSRGWAEYYSDEGDVFVRITNLRRSSITPDWTKTKHVLLPEGMNEGRRTRLTAGDILVSITADLGIIGYIRDEPVVPHYINQHVALVRLDKAKIDSEFVAYLLSSTTMRHAIQRLNDAGAKAGLSLPTIRSIPIKTPPLPEQRKITEILSTWDRAIEVSEALLATARTQKRALMQALLTGQRRFPEFEGQEWKDVMLGDVVSAIRGGGTPDKSNPEYWTGTIPWASVKDLKSDRLYTTVDTISEFGLNNSASNAFDADTIIISTRMAVGVTVRLGCRMAINQDLKAVIPTKAVRNDYLFHCLQMNQPKLEALGTGSTVKGVTLGDLRRMPIGYPKNVDEQDRIVQVVENASEKVLALVGNIQHLRTEKKALMQQLLTGKRRVTV